MFIGAGHNAGRSIRWNMQTQGGNTRCAMRTDAAENESVWNDGTACLFIDETENRYEMSAMAATFTHDPDSLCRIAKVQSGKRDDYKIRTYGKSPDEIREKIPKYSGSPETVKNKVLEETDSTDAKTYGTYVYGYRGA